MAKKALITAAADGIGAATARRVSDAGYSVVICDIDTQRGEAFAAEHGFTYLDCDLADSDAVAMMVQQVGRVDLLVNNGGIRGPVKPVTDITTEEWNHVIAINLTAQFVACREMVPLMRAGGSGGVIVNISSVAAKIGYENRSPYGTTKRAVLGFTAALAREVAADGIRVNAILPGFIRGRRTETSTLATAEARGVTQQEVIDEMLSRQAIKRPIEPEEIGDMIVYLASDAARSITGQAVCVDGGYE